MQEHSVKIYRQKILADRKSYPYLIVLSHLHLKDSAYMKQHCFNCHLTELSTSPKGVLKAHLNNLDILEMFGDISG